MFVHSAKERLLMRNVHCISFLFFECENENKGLKNMDQVEHQEKIRRQNIDRNMFIFLWTSW